MIKLFHVAFIVLMVAIAVVADETPPAVEAEEGLQAKQQRSLSDSTPAPEGGSSAGGSKNGIGVVMPIPILVMSLLMLLFVYKRGELINYKLM